MKGLHSVVQPDDDICYCYHVSFRKLMNFAQREQPPHASGMSECLSAGTGCGWCIPFLRKIHAAAARPASVESEVLDQLPPSAEQYASDRRTYIDSRQTRNQF